MYIHKEIPHMCRVCMCHVVFVRYLFHVLSVLACPDTQSGGITSSCCVIHNELTIILICLFSHISSLFLHKLGKAPEIENLVGTVEFTGTLPRPLIPRPSSY